LRTGSFKKKDCNRKVVCFVLIPTVLLLLLLIGLIALSIYYGNEIRLVMEAKKHTVNPGESPYAVQLALSLDEESLIKLADIPGEYQTSDFYEAF
jgi:hypothetical protein